MKKNIYIAYNVMAKKLSMYKDELNIQKSRVLQAAKEYPEARATLETLFPEVFKEQEVFSRIGVILKRKKYPEQVYALVKIRGEVKILNVTTNSYWQSAVMSVEALSDRNRETITVGEFLKLNGGRNDFYVATEIR